MFPFRTNVAFALIEIHEFKSKCTKFLFLFIAKNQFLSM